ncbi:MAG: penicillin-binding protein A [Tissierellia bacterium]|nr:penicillin-binding protein A [Tissierellia bacterium]
MTDKEKKRTLLLLGSIIFIFVLMMVYLSYFQFFKADKMKHSAGNRRNFIEEETVVRGDIFDRNGEVLASSNSVEENYKRNYSYPELYSHIIGYSDKTLGKTGLEAAYNDYLLNKTNVGLVDAIKRYLSPEEMKGNSLVLTVDNLIQKKTHELMQGKKGAVVALNPKTGEVYSMVSMPDFNPSTIAEDWASINENSDGQLFNRAIKGKYHPGSIFKVVTAASFLRDANLDLKYVHTGEEIVDGYKFHDTTKKSLGEVGLETAFTYSLNTYFANKVMAMGKNTFGKTAEDFMFNKNIPFELSVTESVFNYKDDISKVDIASSAIGQGKVLTNPMNMALVAAGVANEGLIVEPHIIKRIEDASGNVIKSTETKELNRAVSVEIADKLKDMMVDVVNKGTGKSAAIKGIQVAGKTGTAQNESENEHTWFIGFAPAENPVIAIAVVLEKSGGTGSTEAAPIAREIIRTAINRLNTIQ